MDLRSGILSTANALGVNPVDLATAISYETAGTFDPTKRGPTTQWGQHRGLIQFGEPQAQRYGVDWNNPIASQLGPKGAVANYLRDTGVKPGMGLLDIYSAINAGGVGRYNRTDENNGGAPGTVRDKVEQQMAGHRRKAMALLGENAPPMAFAAPQETPMQAPQKATGILGQLFPDMTADRQDRLAMALSGLSMNPNQGVMRAAAQRIDDRRTDRREAQAERKAQNQRNRTLEWLARQPGAEGYLGAVQAGVMTPADAFRAMRTGQQVDTAVVGNKLINKQTGAVIADYSDPEAEAPVNIEEETALRKEYTGRADVKDFRKQADAFTRIRASADNPDAAGDLALIFNYMKLLDPGSVVREGEFATAQNAAGIPERTRNVWNRLQNGERLSEAQRNEFVARAGTIYEAARRQNESTETQYRDIARDYGVNPSRAVPDVSYQSDLAPQAAPRPGVRPEAPPSRPKQSLPSVTRDQLQAAMKQLSAFDLELLGSIPGPEAKLRFLIERGLISGQ